MALVGTYWTAAILAKILTLEFANLTLIPLNEDSPDSSLGDTIGYFTIVIVVDIVCFMLTVDSTFIKIFTQDFIRKTQAQA